MSALSDFLTHSSGPWWQSLAGVGVGGLIANMTTRGSDRRKDRLARDTARRADIRDACSKFLTEAQMLYQRSQAIEIEHKVLASKALLEKAATNPPQSAEEVSALLAQAQDPLHALPIETIDRLGQLPTVIQPIVMAFSELSFRVPCELVDLARPLLIAALALATPSFAFTDEARKTARANYSEALFTFANAVRSRLELDELPRPSALPRPSNS